MTSTPLFMDPKHLLAKADDETSYVHALDRRYGKLMEGSASVAECRTKMVISHVRAGLIGENKTYMRYENINTKADMIRFLVSRGSESARGYKSLF